MDQDIERDVVNPLAQWYRAVGETMPTVETIDGAAMPAPYRDLLVHERDMTSTLESFVGQSLSLEIIGRRDDGDALLREVVLVGDRDGRPAEFGAIRIHVDRIADADARARVLEGRRPLGGILREHGIEHRCRPESYFRVPADALMRKVFALVEEAVLYGRHNLVCGTDGTVLAEVTEILPPAAESAGG